MDTAIVDLGKIIKFPVLVSAETKDDGPSSVDLFGVPSDAQHHLMKVVSGLLKPASLANAAQVLQTNVPIDVYRHVSVFVLDKGLKVKSLDMDRAICAALLGAVFCFRLSEKLVVIAQCVVAADVTVIRSSAFDRQHLYDMLTLMWEAGLTDVIVDSGVKAVADTLNLDFPRLFGADGEFVNLVNAAKIASAEASRVVSRL